MAATYIGFSLFSKKRLVVPKESDDLVMLLA